MNTLGLWAGAACAVLLATTACAHELACESMVDGEVIHEVNHYPAKLHLRFVVRNTHPTDVSVATAVEDALLAKAGLTVETPFSLPVGGEKTEEFTVTVKDQNACLALTGANACGVDVDDVFEVDTDTSSAQCRARIVCGEEKKHCDEGDEACEDDDDENHSCGDEHGDRHGVDFWRTHLEAAKACLAQGEIDLGLFKVKTVSDFESVLWADEDVCSSRAHRELERERISLAKRYVVDACDVRLLGAKFRCADENDEVKCALEGRDCHKLRHFDIEMEEGRDCSCHGGFDAGERNAEKCRSYARELDWSRGETCAQGEGGHD